MKITLSKTMLKPSLIKKSDLEPDPVYNYDFLLDEKPTILVPCDVGCWTISGVQYATMWVNKKELRVIINNGDDYYRSWTFDSAEDLLKWIKQTTYIKCIKGNCLVGGE